MRFNSGFASALLAGGCALAARPRACSRTHLRQATAEVADALAPAVTAAAHELWASVKLHMDDEDEEEPSFLVAPAAAPPVVG